MGLPAKSSRDRLPAPAAASSTDQETKKITADQLAEVLAAVDGRAAAAAAVASAPPVREAPARDERDESGTRLKASLEPAPSANEIVPRVSGVQALQTRIAETPAPALAVTGPSSRSVYKIIGIVATPLLLLVAMLVLAYRN